MLGERCAEVVLEGRGVLGDRLYAVRDGDGKLGSGKSTKSRREQDETGDVQFTGLHPYFRLHISEGRKNVTI